jgi:FkbM family methyltransferase
MTPKTGPIKTALKKLYGAVPFKKELFSLVKKVWQPSENVYKHLHFTGVFDVTVGGKPIFKIKHYGQFLENEVFWGGLESGHERLSYSLWQKLVRNADVILDIGANTGIYSLMAKALNPSAAVYAFEPVVRIFKKLDDNRSLNNFDFTCVQKALSNFDGEAVLFDLDADHAYSASLSSSWWPESADVVEVSIEVERLDTFIDENKIDRVDLMKIDVESREPEVLEGMGRYLEKHRPIMLIEIINDEIGIKVEELVAGNDYLFFSIDDQAGTIRQVEQIRKSDFWNYLLCTPSVAKDLGLVAGK